MPPVHRFCAALRRLLPPSSPPPRPPEEHRRLHATRHHLFHELLVAQHHILDTMAEMDAALGAGNELTMPFLRARCTLISVNAYKIIHHLNQLSDGRHGELERIFRRLQRELDALLDLDPSPGPGRLILTLDQIRQDQAPLVGTTFAGLGEAGTLPGISIPPGFVLTAHATRLFFHHNQLYPRINHLLQQTDTSALDRLTTKSEAIQHLIRQASLPPEVETQLFAHYDRLTAANPGCLMRVCASTVGDSSSRASHAGLEPAQFPVARNQLTAVCLDLLAASYSLPAIAYLQAYGLRHEESMVCLGIMALPKPVLSGHTHTRALSGPEEALSLFFSSASCHDDLGENDPASVSVQVSRKPPHFLLPPAEPDAPPFATPLTADQVTDLTRIGLCLEAHWATPQEFTWTIDALDRIALIHCHPLIIPPQGATATLPPEDQHRFLTAGVTGCPGTASGPVCLVRTPADLLRFPRGAVLVTPHPRPEWTPLLFRASALVTETGDESSHLATLARELGLPTLMAVPRATERLTVGEVITVDSTRRSLHRGRIDTLLHQTAPRPHPMAGSPVQQALTRALGLITPLHLTDPAAPTFNAAHCRTMHDLTRFGHEQAIREILLWSERHPLEGPGIRRLKNSLPMAWQVIDLGGGLRPDLPPQNQDLAFTDIVCPPLLALLDGLLYAPWKNRPGWTLQAWISRLTHSVRSFFHRTGACSSPLNEKNYFLISKNYCTLRMRLGANLAMLEAMTGTRPPDRRLSFRLQAQAMGNNQQPLPLDVLAEVLEHSGFQVNLTGQVLTARVDQGTDQFLRRRLRLLGHLVMSIWRQSPFLAGTREQQFSRDTIIKELKAILHHDQ